MGTQNADEWITLAEASKRIGPRRGGRMTHLHTLHKWIRDGLLKGRVKLSAEMRGGIWMVTMRRIEEFWRECQRVSMALRDTGPTPRQIKARRNAAEKKMKKLLAK